MAKGKIIEKDTELETELQQSQTVSETVTEEGVAAENEMLKEENKALKEEIERLVETPDAQEKSNGVGEAFDYSDEDDESLSGKYKVLSPAIRIPGIGKQTALEILTNEKAQAWLVKNKSGAIKKVF